MFNAVHDVIETRVTPRRTREIDCGSHQLVRLEREFLVGSVRVANFLAGDVLCTVAVRLEMPFRRAAFRKHDGAIVIRSVPERAVVYGRIRTRVIWGL